MLWVDNFHRSVQLTYDVADEYGLNINRHRLVHQDDSTERELEARIAEPIAATPLSTQLTWFEGRPTVVPGPDSAGASIAVLSGHEEIVVELLVRG